MTTYLIRHVTTYRYKSPVAFGVHRFMLRPRESLDQRISDYRLEISPEPSEIALAEDPAGNVVGHATFGRRARELRFAVESRVDVTVFDPARLRLAQHARSAPFSYGAEEMPDLARFIERQHSDPEHSVGPLVARDPGGGSGPRQLGLPRPAERRDPARLLLSAA